VHNSPTIPIYKRYVMYEECRLLGYKNPVRTSQETHYVSATEPSRFYVRFEVSTAVTMKNVVFWDKKHRSYLTGDTLLLRYKVQQVNSM
jgi:hypothetical protein